jgi:hypothetical protein
VTERVDDVAEPPAVLVSDQRRFLRSGADGVLDDPVGVVDDEQRVGFANSGGLIFVDESADKVAAA